MKIMMAGGCDENHPLGDAAKHFAASLARQIIKQNHTVLSGNLTPFDQFVIEAAWTEALSCGTSAARVISYAPKDAEIVSPMGLVLRSHLGRWDHIGRKLLFPEPIQEADIIILIGGWDGTHTAANWAKLAGKPVLPVASYGLAAAEIFSEREVWVPLLRTKVSNDELNVLNRIPAIGGSNVDASANDLVSLAERVVLSRDVFVVMSYRNDIGLIDAKTVIKEACERHGFNGLRLDDSNPGATYQITEKIEQGLRGCAFAIVDLTDGRPNVYYELGYAQALGNPLCQRRCPPFFFSSTFHAGGIGR